MSNKNIGLKIEIDIVNHINQNKFINKMNNNIQNFLKFIFDTDLNNKEIHASKFYENYKPDITITVNGITKYISIKTGSNNSVHQEHLYSFLHYLENTCNFSASSIEALKFFHFNDGTIKGDGKMRKSATDYQESNQINIQKINKELNNKNIIFKSIDRILFKGEYYNIPIVDFIYYGTLETGIWASREEILNYLTKIDFYSASPHISKLYYQNLHRNLKRDLYYEYKRYFVQFKWHSLKEDLEYITKKRKKA